MHNAFIRSINYAQIHWKCHLHGSSKLLCAKCMRFWYVLSTFCSRISAKWWIHWLFSSSQLLYFTETLCLCDLVRFSLNLMTSKPIMCRDAKNAWSLYQIYERKSICRCREAPSATEITSSIKWFRRNNLSQDSSSCFDEISTDLPNRSFTRLSVRCTHCSAVVLPAKKWQCMIGNRVGTARSRGASQNFSLSQENDDVEDYAYATHLNRIKCHLQSSFINNSTYRARNWIYTLTTWITLRDTEKSICAKYMNLYMKLSWWFQWTMHPIWGETIKYLSSTLSTHGAHAHIMMSILKKAYF